MRNIRSRWMISLLMVLADWYIFSAIRSVSSHSQEHTKILIYSIFWSLSLVSVLTMLLFPYFQSATKLKSLRNHVFAMLIEMYRFKILMSHDPSHWQAEVTTKYPDINLTLSGHTHGMQFGFELPWIKWSPVQWVYKRWAGLYGSGEQRLYVNRGFGFLGYPGRVGILPEITVFELL